MSSKVILLDEVNLFYVERRSWYKQGRIQDFNMKWLGIKALTGSEALAGIEALARGLWISIYSAGQEDRLKSSNFR